MKRHLLAGALLLAPAFAGAQDAPPAAAPADAAPGSFVGPERCAECHKPGGEKGRGPLVTHSQAEQMSLCSRKLMTAPALES